jgi:hypothetical protein
MVDDNVVPLKPGATATAPEQQFLDEMARKLRAYVEKHGRMPDVGVMVMYHHEEGGMCYASGYLCANQPRGKLEVYGTALGILTKAMND